MNCCAGSGTSRRSAACSCSALRMARRVVYASLEFRTGTGLIFKVAIERGMDVGYCEYRGQSLAWIPADQAAGPLVFRAAGGRLAGCARRWAGSATPAGWCTSATRRRPMWATTTSRPGPASATGSTTARP